MALLAMLWFPLYRIYSCCITSPAMACESKSICVRSVFEILEGWSVTSSKNLLLEFKTSDSIAQKTPRNTSKLTEIWAVKDTRLANGLLLFWPGSEMLVLGPSCIDLRGKEPVPIWRYLSGFATDSIDFASIHVFRGTLSGYGVRILKF